MSWHASIYPTPEPNSFGPTQQVDRFRFLMSHHAPTDASISLSTSPSLPDSAEQVSRQLLLELSQAAEAAMVATRTRDAQQQTPNKGPWVIIPEPSSKRRKVVDNRPSLPIRSGNKEDVDESITISGKGIGDVLEATEEEATPTTNADMEEKAEHMEEKAEDTQTDAKKGRCPSGHSRKPAQDSPKEAYPDPLAPLTPSRPEHAPAVPAGDRVAISTSSRPVVKQVESGEILDMFAEPAVEVEGTTEKVDAIEEEVNHNPPEGEIVATMPSTSVMKRFGSEQALQTVEPPAKEADGPVEEPNAVEEQDSDDDAPEEVQTGAVEDRVAAAEAKAAESAAKEEATRKAKQKGHDQRMRAQAEMSKQAASVTKPASEDTLLNDSEPELSPNAQLPTKHGKAPLPALLPDELLNAEPARWVPTPSLALERNGVANKKRKILLDQRDRPPKDIVRGNRRIRILPKERANLPPKSSSQVKEIRERWLMGQRGSKPRMWTQRMKPSNGFVRNPK